MPEDRSIRRGGRVRVAVAAVLLTAAMTVSTALPAGAVPPPPPNPSDQQIHDSETQAQSSAAEVGRLSGQVSVTQAKIQQLQDDMELKAELAMKAQVDLQVAQADAADAQQAAKKAKTAAANAGKAIVTAQGEASQFAAASFRQGSVLGSMTALLDSNSMDQLIARQQMIDQVSDSQLGVLTALESARANKANLDSKARAALEAATKAEAKAKQAQQAAVAAKIAAQNSFNQGQQQLKALETKLTQQQAQYQAALNKVADLKGQRQQYNAWLQAKQLEEQRLAQQAELQAQQARAAMRQRQLEQQQQDDAAAAKAVAVSNEKDRQARILAEQIRQEKIRQEKIRQARIKRQQEQAAREAAARDAAAKKNQNSNSSSGSSNSSGSSGSGGSSSGSNYSPPPSPPPSNLSRGQQVVQAALAWLGTPYAWGGGTASGPSQGIHDWGVADYYGDYNKIGFDCSGLALYAWAQVGVYLPHYSAYQYFSGRHVSASNLQPGDLVFYANNTSDPYTIHHVAIYMGNNQMIEAPQSGSYVKISPMRWSGYIGATRPGT